MEGVQLMLTNLRSKEFNQLMQIPMKCKVTMNKIPTLKMWSILKKNGREAKISRKTIELCIHKKNPPMKS